MNSGVVRGEVVNHKRVARLMKANGLFGYTRRRKVKAIVADKHRRVFAGMVERRFCAGLINEVYVGDITYPLVAVGAKYSSWKPEGPCACSFVC